MAWGINQAILVMYDIKYLWVVFDLGSPATMKIIILSYLCQFQLVSQEGHLKSLSARGFLIHFFPQQGRHDEFGWCRDDQRRQEKWKKCNMTMNREIAQGETTNSTGHPNAGQLQTNGESSSNEWKPLGNCLALHRRTNGVFNNFCPRCSNRK